MMAGLRSEPPENRRSDRLRWRRQRLRAMSAPEIAHRLAEALRRQTSRARHPRLERILRAGTAELRPLPGLAEGVRAIAGETEVTAEWEAAAEMVRQGRPVALGVTWPKRTGPPDWHLDPVSGAPWPGNRYTFDIDYRFDPARGRGDVKYVWEINRLQYLQPVAALAAIRRDDRLMALCGQHLANWIAENPPFLGPGWASGIECALRSVSMLVVASLIGASFDPRMRQRLVECLAWHAYWIARFPSRFSSANNHRVAEAGALFLLGRLLPGLKAGRRLSDRAMRDLEREAERQILADGVGAEQSPSYEAFTLEWLLLAGVAARRLGTPFPEAYWERVRRGARFLRAIQDKDGNVPRIGDEDEGRVIAPALAEPRYVASVTALAAAELEEPALAPARALPSLRTALSRTAPAGVPQKPGLMSFAEGGYTVMRRGEGSGERLLVFDHGPLGFLSIAAHGHADALSLWLHIGGRPVLVDAGTYLYHAGGAFREHLRGTAAHNTLLLERASQSETAGPFNWARKARAARLACADEDGAWEVEARHDGYVQRFGIFHRRRVAWPAPERIEITDWLEPASEHAPSYAPSHALVEIGFQFPPDLSVSPHLVNSMARGWRIGFDDGDILTVSQSGPLAGSVQIGERDPFRGWVSPRFGAIEPAPRLVFTGEMPLGAPLVTRLVIGGGPGAA